MKYIKSVKTYNVPIEKPSNDRFIEEVDTKLTKFLVEDLGEPSKTNNKIAWEIVSTTKATFTITGKKANYLRLESELFDTKKITYWFLTTIKAVNSRKAYAYEATLDTVATFGVEVMNQLKDREVEIERFHGNRWVVENSKVVLNKQHHSLLNSDFKIGDTKGSVYKGLGTRWTSVDDVHYPLVELAPSTDGTGLVVTDHSQIGISYFESYASATINNISYFKYAIVSGPSFRKYLATDPMFKKHIANKIFADALKIDNMTNYGDYYVIPIMNSVAGSTVRDVTADVVGGNTIEWLQNLPEGVVLSIEYTPEPITFLPFRRFGDTTGNNNCYGLRITAEEAGKGVNNLTFMPLVDFSQIHKIKTNMTSLIWVLYGIKTELTTLPTTDREVEIGVVNGDIAKLELRQGGEYAEIDTFKFINKSKEYMELTQVLTPNGVAQSLTVSEDQHILYDQTNDLTFFTNRGATYLAENRSQIEAQKRRIDLEINKENLSEKRQRIQNIGGGGLMGGLMSMINPVNWLTGFGHQAGITSTTDIMDANIDIGKARKHEIDAHIADLSSAPSAVNMAKSNSASIFLDKGDHTNSSLFEMTWSFRTNLPNKLLLDKIINYYKAFATPFKSWRPFTEDIWKNMNRFNYLKMPRLRDYLNATTDIDDDIIEDLTKDFEAGVRLWHTNDVDITKLNLEKTVITKLTPRKK